MSEVQGKNKIEELEQDHEEEDDNFNAKEMVDPDPVHYFLSKYVNICR